MRRAVLGRCRLLTLANVHDRLVEAVSRVGGLAVDPMEVRGLPVEEPQAMEAGLAGLLPGRTLLAGTIERRLLVTEQPDVLGWTVADLSGQPLASWPWPARTDGRVQLDRAGSWLSTASITDDGVSR